MELQLDRKISNRRIYPAIDITVSAQEERTTYEQRCDAENLVNA